MGGVVGGVIKSMAIGELATLVSSAEDSSLSPASLVDEAEWVLLSFLRLMLMLKCGKNEVLGDRLASFLEE